MDNKKRHLKASVIFMICKEELQEIFKTRKGGVYQSNKHNKLYIDFQDSMIAYSVPCFLCLKKMIDKIDLEAMLSDSSSGGDLEIIAPCGIDKCYVLSVKDVYYFKELLNGARVMLDLNSIIYERLYSVPV